MAFCTWFGMFLLITVAIFALAFIFGMIFVAAIGECNLNYGLVLGLILTVIVVVGFGSLIYLRFQDNPEEFGYTRIETEVTQDVND